MNPAVDQPGKPVLPYFRVLSLIVSGILFAAARILFFFPDETATMFSWEITSHMTSYLIGAGYLGGAFFFLYAFLFGGRLKWHEVRLAIPPVTAFTITMAGITLRHWDRFSHDIFPGQLWDFLYFTLPFLLPLVMLHHERQRGEWLPDSNEVGSRLRYLYFGVGLFLFVYGCILFFFPGTIRPTWPWPLTVVTTMAVGGWLILPGVAGLLLPLDRRWSAWRVLIAAQGISVFAILVGAFAARDEFDNGSFSYVFIASLIGILVMIAAIYGRQEYASRKGALRPA